MKKKMICLPSSGRARLKKLSFKLKLISVLVLMGALVLSTSSFAQNQQERELTGTATDQEGLPVLGVSVMVKGTTIGTITDLEGNYQLSVPENAEVVVFSFVGMKTQELPIGNRDVIDIVMEQEAIGIAEVVAIGYGYQTKREISGSITNVTNEEFNKGIMNSAADLLKGKVAGLQITQAGGDVTSSSTIRLRGTTSLSASSEPLIVIDGIPGLSLDMVAPENIESVTVLKDASASAIYGSRGANGVIMITTRKGMASKTQIEYNSFVAIETPAKLPRFLTATEYRDYIQEAGISNFDDAGGDTDWWDEISRNGVSQQHNIALSGGGEKHNYIGTVNYQDRQGVILSNEMKKLNARFSFSQRALKDKLKVTITGLANQRNWTPIDYWAFLIAKNMRPTEPVFNPDGSYYEPYDYDIGNPVSMLKLNRHDRESNHTLINGMFELDLLKGLTYNLNLTRSNEKEVAGEYINSTTRAGVTDNGLATREAEQSSINILETNLTYKANLNNHNLTLMAGYSYEERVWDDFDASNRDFITDDFLYNNLAAGNDLRPDDIGSGKAMSRLISFYGRAQYDLHERYFATFTIRRDGSSKFGANNKWGYFPSGSVAWRISEESFLSDLSWMDELKIRAGYGSSGNQSISPYRSLATYGSAGKFIDQGEIITGYSPNQNPNPNLRWETTTQYNVGIDFQLFSNRVGGAIEYYNKQTKDLLYNYPVPVPPYLYEEILANVGDMENKGFEALVNVDVLRGSDFQWNVGLNFSTNKNKVISLSNDQFVREYVILEGEGARGLSSNTSSILEPGQEIGTFYSYKFKEFDENGKWVFEDINGDGAITPGRGNDYTYTGYALPDFTWGLTNSFNYKNIDLTMFFRGIVGGDIMNFSRIVYENINNVPQGNVYKTTLDIPLDDSFVVSDYYIEDGTFTRLEYLTLGYTLMRPNSDWLKQLRIYFTGQNLLTITQYSGTDPEVPMDSLTPGLEERRFYPKARTFTFGINVTF